MNEATRQVLQMLHNGVITADEAARLLNAMGETVAIEMARAGSLSPLSDQGIAEEAGATVAEALEDATGAVTLHRPHIEPAGAAGIAPLAPTPNATHTGDAPPGPPGVAEDLARLREFWRFPFGVSLIVMGAVALGMVSNYDNFGFITPTFVCLWGVFVGAAILAGLSLWSRGAPWMHLRVRNGERDYRLSLPTPIRLAAWGLRAARPFMGERFKDADLDALTLSLDGDVSPENPFYAEVHDTESGNHVQVYIG